MITSCCAWRLRWKFFISRIRHHAGERCGEWRAYSSSFGVTYHSRLGFKFIAPVFKLHNAVIRETRGSEKKISAGRRSLSRYINICSMIVFSRNSYNGTGFQKLPRHPIRLRGALKRIYDLVRCAVFSRANSGFSLIFKLTWPLCGVIENCLLFSPSWSGKVLVGV